jgi:hypothetical protein
MPASPPGRVARLVRAAGAVTVLGVGLLGLAGCDAGGEPAPTPTATAAPTGGSSTTNPTTTPTPAEEPVEPLGLGCDELLTLDDVYAYNPNVGVDPGYEPASELAERVIALGGTACGLLNQSSGATIEYAAANVGAETSASLKAAAATQANAVPTYGTPPSVDGFFAVDSGVGTAQVFTAAGQWIVVDSTEFFEPGDAQTLVESMLGNLPAG